MSDGTIDTKAAANAAIVQIAATLGPIAKATGDPRLQKLHALAISYCKESDDIFSFLLQAAASTPAKPTEAERRAEEARRMRAAVAASYQSQAASNAAAMEIINRALQQIRSQADVGRIGENVGGLGSVASIAVDAAAAAAMPAAE